MTLAQFVSILFSYAIYNVVFGWKLAVLLIFGVGFHECCHLYAAKKLRYPTGGFYLLPFLGGVSFVTSQYRSLKDQAIVVLAGPLGGGLMACLFSVAYFITHIPIIGAAAVWMLILNMFNLLPLSFMDGGQLMGTITYSISRKFGLICKIISTLAAMALLLKMNWGLALVISLFGGMEISQEIRSFQNLKAGRRWLVPENYLNPPKILSKIQIGLTVLGHVGTTCLLGGTLVETLHQLQLQNVESVFNLLK